MNDRIAELKEAAMYDQWGHGAFGESERHRRLDADKLARLVMEDCIDAVGRDSHAAQIICKRFGIEWSPTMTDIRDGVELFTLTEWEKAMNEGWFNSDDGSGYWATTKQMAHACSVWGPRPAWATCVAWFNK